MKPPCKSAHPIDCKALPDVLKLNKEAYTQLGGEKTEVVDGATHLFEERENGSFHWQPTGLQYLTPVKI